MLPYTKAKLLAETWIELTTDGTCEISKVEDKPYGWVFYYNSKEHNPNGISSQIAGNSPIIIDRTTGEIRVTGTAYPVEDYLKEYESTLPESRLLLTPEKHDGVG